MAVNTSSGTTSATFGLSISEKWIRERLNLHKDSLDDVRSLSLPGSYNQKITHLGRSLLSFSRLKHIDLSRNAIESLEGLEHLKNLETLNLYYNNVPSLEELFQLGHNKRLKVLDLRLNPVTKNEPDYRLFVIHMLVNLRKLDDRSVRDGERKAALMHFDTDQAYQFDGHFRPQTRRDSREEDHSHKYIEARTDLVKTMAPYPTALEDDTDHLLELIANRDRLLTPSPPPPRPQHHHTPRPTIHQSLESSTPIHYNHPSNKRYSSPTVNRQQQVSLETDRGFSSSHSSSHPSPHAKDIHVSRSRERHFDDNLHGYTDFRRKGNFTPAPSVDQNSEDSTSQSQGSSYLACKQLLALLQEHVDGDLMVLQQDPAFQNKFSGWYEGHTQQMRGAASILAGGGQMESLHGEIEALQKELASMEGQLREKDKVHQDKEKRIKEMEELLSQRISESAELGKQLRTQVATSEEMENKQEDLHKTIQKMRQDLSSLQQQLSLRQEENKTLQTALGSAPSVSEVEATKRQLGEVQIKNRSLREELETVLDRHKQDLTNISQIQELASMLQECHGSLVATNDHLLQELEEAKQRHSQEVLQMNVSYEHLRKTVQLYK